MTIAELFQIIKPYKHSIHLTYRYTKAPCFLQLNCSRRVDLNEITCPVCILYFINNVITTDYYKRSMWEKRLKDVHDNPEFIAQVIPYTSDGLGR